MGQSEAAVRDTSESMAPGEDLNLPEEGEEKTKPDAVNEVAEALGVAELVNEATDEELSPSPELAELVTEPALETAVDTADIEPIEIMTELEGTASVDDILDSETKPDDSSRDSTFMTEIEDTEENESDKIDEQMDVIKAELLVKIDDVSEIETVIESVGEIEESKLSEDNSELMEHAHSSLRNYESVVEETSTVTKDDIGIEEDPVPEPKEEVIVKETDETEIKASFVEEPTPEDNIPAVIISEEPKKEEAISYVTRAAETQADDDIPAVIISEEPEVVEDISTVIIAEETKAVADVAAVIIPEATKENEKVSIIVLALATYVVYYILHVKLCQLLQFCA